MRALAVPTIDTAGQDAGFASNTAATHAPFSVLSLAGSCLGRLTLTLAMFAWPAPEATLTCRPAPLALLVFAGAVADSLGANGSPAQPPTWKGEETFSTAPSLEEIVPVTASGAQSVGLNMKPVLFTVRLIAFSRSGTPARIFGKASEVTVRWPSCESTAIEARTTTVPRSYGPASACTTTERPNGAPW